VKGIHTTGAEQGYADGGGGGVMLDTKVGETAGKGAKHGIQNFCGTHSGNRFDLEWHLGITKIKSHQIMEGFRFF
jgi:hypothetical protein